MALALSNRVTGAEYLAFEREAEAAHELIDGVVVAMSGASRRHDTLAGNLFAALHEQLRKRGRACRPFTSHMRVRVDPDFHAYPDLSVVCGEPRFEDAAVDSLLNPTLLVEIASPSTAAFDRGVKWERYRRLSSLREYLLLEQSRVHVELYRRREDGSWLLWETNDREATLRLESIACEVFVGDLYEDVELDDAGPPGPRAGSAVRRAG